MIQLKHSKLERTDYGSLTTFEDGKSIASIPHYQDHHYHVIAHRTGYEDDLHTYCVEHDFAHLFVMEKLHGIPSPILWALAHGEKIPENAQVFEELASQTFQRYLRANEQPIIGGVPWPELKQEALALLGQPPFLPIR